MPKSDQGVTHQRYKVIPRTLIFLFRGDQVLLIRGAPSKRLWANRYNGLGGHIERGESVLAAARRELEEEAGIQVNGLQLAGTLMVDASEDTGICLFILQGEYAGGEVLASQEGLPEWIDTGQMEGLPLVEDLRAILPRVMQARIENAPFFARSYYDAQEKLQLVFEDQGRR
jgi:8-oxo-dGTP diphosphatase